MQRYFITAESTYEDLRQHLNGVLKYPNESGKTVFQTALQAPRDSFRRVLVAVDTELTGYSTIANAIAPLLESDAMEELDEATYLAAVASATGGGGAAAYSLPTATASVLGGVKIGSGISIDANGVISASSAYTLPAATTSSLGGVIVGSGLSVSSGTISAAVTSVNGLTGAVVVIATYATADLFPATGNAATLYVESDTGRVYQWTGSVYAETGIDSAAGQHASQHGAAGSDPITIATSQVTGFNAAASAASPVQSVNGATGAVTVSTGKPLGLILALT